MSFTESEIAVGMIAYFSINDLRGDPYLVFKGGSPDDKRRPFVCFAIDTDDRLYWTPLTTDNGQPSRTSIKKDWIINAVGIFTTKNVIVNDGLHTYLGSAQRFAYHSARFDKYTTTNRPALTVDGIATVVSAVKSRDGLLPSEANTNALTGGTI